MGKHSFGAFCFIFHLPMFFLCNYPITILQTMSSMANPQPPTPPQPSPPNPRVPSLNQDLPPRLLHKALVRICLWLQTITNPPFEVRDQDFQVFGLQSISKHFQTYVCSCLFLFPGASTKGSDLPILKHVIVGQELKPFIQSSWVSYHNTGRPLL